MNMKGFERIGEVRVDSRNRVNLKGIGRDEHTRYRVEQLGDGVLLFTPVVIVDATPNGKELT